jgi:hypothetical protein
MTGDLRYGSWITIGASCRSLGWWRSWRRSWICYWKKLCTQLLALLPTLLCTVLCTRSILSTTTLLARLLLPSASIPASIPTSRVPSPIVSFFSPFSRLPVKSKMTHLEKRKPRRKVCPKCRCDLGKYKLFISAWRRCPQCGFSLNEIRRRNRV